MKWPQLRAAIITLHIMAAVLIALPAPSRIGLAVGDPDLGEVRPWARRLGVDEKALVARVLAAARGWLAVRDYFLRPIDHYFASIGAPQDWHMFSTPNKKPVRLHLEARRVALADESAEWERVSGLPVGRWRPAMFESERMRHLVNAIARYDGGELSRSLCRWLANELLRDQPEWAEVRCQLVQTPTPRWRSTETPEPRVIFSLVVPRSP